MTFSDFHRDITYSFLSRDYFTFSRISARLFRLLSSKRTHRLLAAPTDEGEVSDHSEKTKKRTVESVLKWRKQWKFELEHWTVRGRRKAAACATHNGPNLARLQNLRHRTPGGPNLARSQSWEHIGGGGAVDGWAKMSNFIVCSWLPARYPMLDPWSARSSSHLLIRWRYDTRKQNGRAW